MNVWIRYWEYPSYKLTNRTPNVIFSILVIFQHWSLLTVMAMRNTAADEDASILCLAEIYLRVNISTFRDNFGIQKHLNLKKGLVLLY